MVLYYRSTALGEDRPVVIYAGKDKVRPALCVLAGKRQLIFHRAVREYVEFLDWGPRDVAHLIVHAG